MKYETKKEIGYKVKYEINVELNLRYINYKFKGK